MLGAVVGGAMFGDNLSMISDTTIAATRTQETGMKEKFRVNIRIAIPAAVVVLLIYFFSARSGTAVPPPGALSWRDLFLVLPYGAILVSAQIKTAESLYNSNPAECFRLSLYNVQATSQTLLSVWRPVTFIFNCITLCQLFFQ